MSFINNYYLTTRATKMVCNECTGNTRTDNGDFCILIPVKRRIEVKDPMFFRGIWMCRMKIHYAFLLYRGREDAIRSLSGNSLASLFTIKTAVSSGLIPEP